MKFFITGTPGTGKTTLSFELKKQMRESPDIYEIKELLIKFDLLEEYEPERDTTVFDDESAIYHIQNFLKEKDNYILVGPSLPFDEIEFTCVIVLTCSLKSSLEERLAKRGYKQSKIKDNIEAELFGEILGETMDFFSEKCKLLVLDSCIKSPEELIIDLIHFLGLR